ncbi:MAG: hypothetical protein JRJ29_20630 [Deltaproteobacteria bacterium]|nr:hypothetical protein [Deltaproteobacteria bacterium]
MNRKHKIQDAIYLFLLIMVLLGLPFAIRAYDGKRWQDNFDTRAKIFTLTGHAQKGWLMGEVHAVDVIRLWNSKDKPLPAPVIRVSRGDRVVLRLKSSDVIHGFSLKDFGIFVNKGIEPGKVILVSFKADRAGVFTFSCNAICGDNHKDMKGTLIVTA